MNLSNESLLVDLDDDENEDDKSFSFIMFLKEKGHEASTTANFHSWILFG